MPQSLSQIYVHLVYSTKHRHPYLKEALWREQLFAYLATVCRTLKSPSLRVGGVEDHVHLLLNLGRVSCVADLVRELKRSSSKWLKTLSPALKSFDWQDGYGAFSISPSHLEALTRYIANQEQHHRKESFQEEYRRLLRKYHVKYDEKYVWD